VLNGKIIKASGGQVDLESCALDLREVVVALEDSALPAITVNGKPVKVTVIDSPERTPVNSQG